MAIQQYSFLIIPKESQNNVNEELNKLKDNDGFIDDEFFWLQKPVKTSFFHHLRSILDEAKSWSKDIVLYGLQDSNCFEVYKNEIDQVASVSFRIDYTSDYKAILQSIIEFCIKKELAIIDERLNILPMNINKINKVIEDSPQYAKYIELSL